MVAPKVGVNSVTVCALVNGSSAGLGAGVAVGAPTPHVWPPPLMEAGTGCVVTSPFPSCPALLPPQVHTMPAASSATLWLVPPERRMLPPTRVSCTGVLRFVVVLSPTCELPLAPHPRVWL